MKREGFVYLVGAGPGDPRLLTMRAYELLRSAEVVAHDELVTPAILALAPRDAEMLPVGRRHGSGTVTHRLHPAVLERARAGQAVVRLKSGDPLIFGRGGEEAEELAEAGISYEIVPGISAALGAAAYAGIPLTHRVHSSAVTFATGHDADGIDRPRGETIVLYMSVRKLANSFERLLARGLKPTTPAAYVASATTPDQRVIVGTLVDLPGKVAGVDPSVPALIIVGEVVALRERIAWFERRPLAGRRLLVARARPGRSAIAAELRALGAEVLEAPDVEAVPPAPLPPIDLVVLPNSSATHAILSGELGEELRHVPMVVLGRRAEQVARHHGAQWVVRANENSPKSLVAAAVSAVGVA